MLQPFLLNLNAHEPYNYVLHGLIKLFFIKYAGKKTDKDFMNKKITIIKKKFRRMMQKVP